MLAVLIVLAALVLFDVLAWYLGEDSRDGRDWSTGCERRLT